MPLFGFGSTRSDKGTDAGEEASATALCKTLRKRQAEEMGIEHTLPLSRSNTSIFLFLVKGQDRNYP